MLARSILNHTLVLDEMERLQQQGPSAFSELFDETDWSKVQPSCPWPRKRQPYGDLIALDFRAPRVWNVFIAAPHCDRKAADWLKREREAVYFANYVRQVCSRGGIRRSVIEPVLPGILFVARQPDSDLQGLVERVPGLIAWLRDSEQRPCLVTEQEILAIRNLEAGHNLPAPPPKPAYAYKVGEMVKIVDGTFLDWQGPVTGVYSKGRISVEVKWLGRKVKAILTASQIEPMQAKAGGKAASPG